MSLSLSPSLTKPGSLSPSSSPLRSTNSGTCVSSLLSSLLLTNAGSIDSAALRIAPSEQE